MYHDWGIIQAKLLVLCKPAFLFSNLNIYIYIYIVGSLNSISIPFQDVLHESLSLCAKEPGALQLGFAKGIRTGVVLGHSMPEYNLLSCES